MRRRVSSWWAAVVPAALVAVTLLAPRTGAPAPAQDPSYPPRDRPADPPGAWVIQPGHEGRISGLFAPFEGGAGQRAGAQVNGISVRGDGFEVEVSAPDGRQARIAVQPPVGWPETAGAAQLRVGEGGDAGVAAPVLAHLRQAADADFWREVLSRAPAPTRVNRPRAPDVLPQGTTGSLQALKAHAGNRLALQYFFVFAALLVAMLGSLFAALRLGWRAWRDPGLRRSLLAEVPAPLAIATIAAVVRFAGTTRNSFMDADVANMRLLHFDGLHDGLNVLIRFLLPASLEGFYAPAVLVVSVLAALTPPLAVLLARGLGCTRPVAALAGLMLACWPLHAALYTSDVVQGPVVTFATLALALGAVSGRLRAPGPLAVAALWLAWLIWCRPEVVLVVGLLGVAAWPGLWGFRRRPWLWMAGLWLLASVGVRLLLISAEVAAHLSEMVQAPGAPGPVAVGHPAPSGGPVLQGLGGVVGAMHPAVLPLWLWVPALPGLRACGSTARALVLGSVAVATLLVLGPWGLDLTRIEFYRYSAIAAPGVAIASAEGVLWMAGTLARWRWRRTSGFPGADAAAKARAERWARVAWAAVVLWVCLTPAWYRGYLTRSYGPTVDRAVFGAILPKVEPSCGFVVPGEARDDGLDPGLLYVELAREHADRVAPGSPPAKVVVASEFAATVQRTGRLPQLSAPGEGGQGAGDPCWIWHRGSACYFNVDLVVGEVPDPGGCKALEAAVTFESLDMRAMPLRHHSGVVNPDREVAPWWVPDARLGSARVTGPRRARSAP